MFENINEMAFRFMLNIILSYCISGLYLGNELILKCHLIFSLIFVPNAIYYWLLNGFLK